MHTKHWNGTMKNQFVGNAFVKKIIDEIVFPGFDRHNVNRMIFDETEDAVRSVFFMNYIGSLVIVRTVLKVVLA